MELRLRLSIELTGGNQPSLMRFLDILTSPPSRQSRDYPQPMSFSSLAQFSQYPRRWQAFLQDPVVCKVSLVFHRDFTDFFPNWGTFVKILRIWSDHLFPQYVLQQELGGIREGGKRGCRHTTYQRKLFKKLN